MGGGGAARSLPDLECYPGQHDERVSHRLKYYIKSPLVYLDFSLLACDSINNTVDMGRLTNCIPPVKEFLMFAER